MKQISKYLGPWVPKDELKKQLSVSVYREEFCDLEPIKLTSIKLTSYQKKFLPAILWLVGSAPRRSGRTTILVIALLSLAVSRKGQWIKIADHTLWSIPEMEHIISRTVFLTEMVEIASREGVSIEVDHKKLLFRAI
jgi:hypothetical protein